MQPFHFLAYSFIALSYVLAVLLLSRWLRRLWHQPVRWYRDLVIAIPLTLLLPGGLLCVDYCYPLIFFTTALIIRSAVNPAWYEVAQETMPLWGAGYLGMFAVLRGGRWLLGRRPDIVAGRVSRLAQRVAPWAVPGLALVGLLVYLASALQAHLEHPYARLLVRHPDLPRAAEITLYNPYCLRVLPGFAVTTVIVHDLSAGDTRPIFTTRYHADPRTSWYVHDTAAFSRDGRKLFIADKMFPAGLVFIDTADGAIHRINNFYFRFAGSFADLILVYAGTQDGEKMALYDFSGDTVGLLQLDGDISTNWGFDFAVTDVSVAQREIAFRARQDSSTFTVHF